MAFMVPVVRNDWKIYQDAGRSRESKSCPRSRKSSECRSVSLSGSLSTSPSPHGVIPYNRSLALEIPHARNKPRLSVGSLPSSLHSGHQCSSYSSSPKRNYAKLSFSSRLLKSRLNKSVPVSEPASPSKATIVSPKSEDESPPKSGSQNSLQKFHVRLVDRLRRSLRLAASPDENTGSMTASKETITSPQL